MNQTTTTSPLAVLGGQKAVNSPNKELFHWPIITKEDEDAVLSVLRDGTMSGTSISIQFEAELAAWHKSKYALTFCNGTSSLLGALYGCGVGFGDEVIGPSYTYWASLMPVFSLGAIPVFADINPDSLCIDPIDIERKITPKTKAIMVVHLFGHPADMDAIMKIAKKHNLKVIEDVSHAQGGLYKGKILGTIGDAGAFSCMASKSFSIGEGGVLITNNEEVYHKAISFGFYERTDNKSNYFKSNDPNGSKAFEFPGIPLGGYKHRLNQTCAAMGRVQLKYYNERCVEIRKAMNYFWELLKDTPGIHPHRVNEKEGSTMGGWYCPVGHYKAEELGGLDIVKFVTAVKNEGVSCSQAPYPIPLHLNPAISQADIYGHGMPTHQFNQNGGTRKSQPKLPITENITKKAFTIPWFKHYEPELIETYANAFKKVANNWKDLV
jgi:dTDP-4-amino-4,6-dideoxygalactose transaminase